MLWRFLMKLFGKNTKSNEQIQKEIREAKFKSTQLGKFFLFYENFLHHKNSTDGVGNHPTMVNTASFIRDQIVSEVVTVHEQAGYKWEKN